MKPIGKESWASSVIWGRNHSTFTKQNLNSYLAEPVLPVRTKNFFTGCFELVDKDELKPVGQSVRIGAYAAGYTRDLPSFMPHIEVGLGANFTTYSLPALAKSVYGDRPFGANMFVRFRLKP